MKKICLLLAMLLCLVPVLSACGGAGGAEKAVKKYLDGYYADFDKNVVFENTITYNKDLLKELLDGDDYDAVAYDAWTQFDESYKGWRDGVEEGIKEIKDMAKDADEYEYKYDIYASRVISADDDEFDILMDRIGFNAKIKKMEGGTEYFVREKLLIKDTDLEGLIEEMALVRVVGEHVFTKGDEEKIVADTQELLVLKVDGDWLVFGSYSYDSKFEDDEDLSTWLD